MGNIGFGKSAHFGGDIYEGKPVCIFDIETKERIDFNSVKECAKFLNMLHALVAGYISRKTRKKFNGKKYAIRYKSSIKTP